MCVCVCVCFACVFVDLSVNSKILFVPDHAQITAGVYTLCVCVCVCVHVCLYL